MKIIPQKDFIVLKFFKDEDSRIELLDGTDKSKMGKGHFEVIDKGPDVKYVQIGDNVVPVTGAFQKLTLEGQELHLTKEEFVCLILREENNV